MPLKKIGDVPPTKLRDFPPKPCPHPEHTPPSHIFLEPGVYQHTCPGCGEVKTFTVNSVTW